MGKMEPNKVKEHGSSHTTHTMVQVRDDGELNQDIGSNTTNKRFLKEVDRDPGTTFLEQVVDPLVSVISCVMIPLTLDYRSLGTKPALGNFLAVWLEASY